MRHPFARALRVAEAIQRQLAPYCERIEIAGSIRREESLVKDIELLVIPHGRRDLFGVSIRGEATALDVHLAKLEAEDRLVPREPRRMGERYKALRAVKSDLPLDLFICLPPASWGALMAIRTGPAAYSKRLVTECRRHGLRCTAGTLVDEKDIPVSTPTEHAFILACGLPYLEPRERC